MRTLLSATTCALLTSAALYGQSLPPKIIGHIKKSTVYVEVHRRLPLNNEEVHQSGSGFFVSKKGHVVTSYHVVSPAYGTYGAMFPSPVTEILVVRDSGSRDHTALHAFVMTADKDNDLVLLGVQEPVETPFLDLGAPAALIETAPIWIFGYPFGEAFAVLQQGPEITVNKGFVSALRHNDMGKLLGIQIDAAVNPGTSGGPAVDETGKVIGIVRTVLFGSHVTFAVPSHLLADLVGGIRLDVPMTNAIKLAVVSDPPGASLFVDGRPEGTTPLRDLAVKPGWHALCVMKQGREAWIGERTLLAATNLAVSLPPCRDLVLRCVGKAAPEPPALAPDPALQKLALEAPSGGTNLLLKENFDRRERFDTWEQATGGNEKRTWFLDQGALHQFESDEFLHAIYFGDKAWDNYGMTADVRITDKHHDSRAGLIFRDTDDGFYLFRIHKESGKAQLAYHCKRPFGWLVLKEKKLDLEITNQWFTATACVAGDTIHCFLNGKPVFVTSARHAGKGRIGFYSVESKASFDNLRVFPVTAVPSRAAPAAASELLSFWFRDDFSLKSTAWHPYEEGNTSPAPWCLSDAGCAQLADDDKTRYNEFTRYQMADFGMSLFVSLGEGTTNSCFGIFFRKTDKARLVLSFSRKDGKIRLISEQGNEARTVKENALPDDLFGKTVRLQLTADQDSIVCRDDENELLAARDKDLPVAAGRLGFMTSHLRAVLHDLTVSSPTEKEPTASSRKTAQPEPAQ